MKKIRGAVFSGALLAASATGAFAQGVPSWIPFSSVYVRGDIGGAFGTDTTFKNVPSIPGRAGSTQPSNVHDSMMYGAGFGVRINPMFRTDLTIDGITRLNIEGTNAPFGGTSSAHVSSVVGLVNGYFDLNGLWPNMFGRFQPYIDAGVGIARNNLSRTSFATTGGATIGSVNSHGYTNFAWGAGAGVAYAVAPHMLIDLSYKYLDLGDMHSGTTLSIGAAKVNTPRMSADLKAHTVMIGFRYEFGGPPPAPPPTPVAAPPAPPPAAVAPQRQMFIVFFEFDKSTLTADGRRIVDSAAAAYKSGRSGVQIAGYTDLAGTQQYNLALSKRRADTVKAALVRDGVPASAIDESWHGKENPRVPTADGVREPQNRRVEITM